MDHSAKIRLSQIMSYVAYLLCSDIYFLGYTMTIRSLFLMLANLPRIFFNPQNLNAYEVYTIHLLRGKYVNKQNQRQNLHKDTRKKRRKIEPAKKAKGEGQGTIKLFVAMVKKIRSQTK